MAVFFQLQQDTVPIYIHQRPQGVLGRQRILFIDFNHHFHLGKKLPPDFPLHPQYGILCDQMGAGQINAQKIPAFGGGNPFHRYLLKQCLYLILYL